MTAGQHTLHHLMPLPVHLRVWLLLGIVSVAPNMLLGMCDANVTAKRPLSQILLQDGQQDEGKASPHHRRQRLPFVLPHAWLSAAVCDVLQMSI